MTSDFGERCEICVGFFLVFGVVGSTLCKVMVSYLDG